MSKVSGTSSMTSATGPSTPQAQDIEAQVPTAKAGHWNLLFDQADVTPEVQNFSYAGEGTPESPYVVEYLPRDRRNPLQWSPHRKWTITMLQAIATLAVSFVSSGYTGGINLIMAEFGSSQELTVAGLSVFVLGFAVGPLFWAPMSEIYGRQVLFFTTYGMVTVFNAGSAGAQNIQTLLVLRFFAGAFGSSVLTNAGGVVADMFDSSERGFAMCIYSTAPFLGPTIGPVISGFLGQAEGWRWLEGVMAIFTGIIWIIGTLAMPETYAPLILQKRAKKLSKMTGKSYKTKIEIQQGPRTPAREFSKALVRPWALLFMEPIVLLLTIYMAIIYGTLYMLFDLVPTVYEAGRGWSIGIGGLPFLGVSIGMVSATMYALWDNKRYIRVQKQHKGFAPAEARLPPSMIGSVLIPIGLFWFAWTNYASIHWIVSIMALVPFGVGISLVFMGCMNYLIDSYVIYAASALAATSVLRSLFGAAFPLFGNYMSANLGIHWAAMVPAFLALACVPFPFLFYRYGEVIRRRCKYAAEAAMFLDAIRGAALAPSTNAPPSMLTNETDPGTEKTEDRLEVLPEAAEEGGNKGPEERDVIFASFDGAGDKQAVEEPSNVSTQGNAPGNRRLSLAEALVETSPPSNSALGRWRRLLNVRGDVVG